MQHTLYTQAEAESDEKQIHWKQFVRSIFFVKEKKKSKCENTVEL